MDRVLQRIAQGSLIHNSSLTNAAARLGISTAGMERAMMDSFASPIAPMGAVGNAGASRQVPAAVLSSGISSKAALGQVGSWVRILELKVLGFP